MGTHLVFLSQLLAVVLGAENYFLEEPVDAELLGTRPLILGCRFSEPVQECRWTQGGGILGFQKGRYELAGNEATGDCTLHVLKPQIGLDTTYWQCFAIVDTYARYETKPARVVVKEYARPKLMPYDDMNKSDSEIHDPVVYVKDSEDNETMKTIFMESLVDGDTRVRWYVDGIITATRNSVEDRGLNGQLLLSSLPLLIKQNSDPILIQCCLEVRSGSTAKTVLTRSVYVVDNSYEVRHNQHRELTKLHFKVVPPKLHMVWTKNNQEQVINKNSVVVQTEFIHERNFTVRCVDESGSPSTYLQWGQYDPEGDADVADGGYEFSTTKASREMITMHVNFVRPNRYLTLQCQAGNVIHQGVRRTLSAMFTLRYRNACGENFEELPDEATSKSNIITKQFSLFVLCVFISFMVCH